MRFLFCLIAVLSVTACGEKTDFSSWEGRWLGAEGTILTLSKTEEGYIVSIHDLDDEEDYPATVKDGILQFNRDGETQTLHAGDGKETGMKWLADKHDCLIVTANEGYCRD